MGVGWGRGWVSLIKKENLSQNRFSNNVEWKPINLWKMISADVRTTRNEGTGGCVLYFYNKYPQNLKYNVKISWFCPLRTVDLEGVYLMDKVF